MWRQHLFSKRVRPATPNEAVDGFHVLTDEIKSDSHFTRVIRDRPRRAEKRRIAFIHDCGDRIYVGMDGRLPDVLGESHPHAYEISRSRSGIEAKGRSITFIHGYFAPKGTPIPDLGELIDRQPNDLAEILQRANGGEEQVKADSVIFSRPRKKGTEWDRIATEFEQGRRPLQGATFTEDGAHFETLGTPSVTRTSVAGITADLKKNPSLLSPDSVDRMGFLKVVAICLGAVIAGCAAWRLLENHRRNENGPNR